MKLAYNISARNEMGGPSTLCLFTEEKDADEFLSILKRVYQTTGRKINSNSEAISFPVFESCLEAREFYKI